jgi:hypothetical protein
MTARVIERTKPPGQSTEIEGLFQEYRKLIESGSQQQALAARKKLLLAWEQAEKK